MEISSCTAIISIKKKCPDEENYIFFHEHSKMCKYGNKCERNLCMYKHSNEETNIIEVDTNVTFQTPYVSEKLECANCDFVTPDKKEFEMHMDKNLSYM